jgi:hypothetical protein
MLMCLIINKASRMALPEKTHPELFNVSALSYLSPTRHQLKGRTIV